MYTPSWECRSFVCMHLAHEILMKSMTSTSLLLLDSLGNPFRAISRILSPQKSLAVKISFTVVEYITYTNSPQEKKKIFCQIFLNTSMRWDLVLQTSFVHLSNLHLAFQSRKKHVVYGLSLFYTKIDQKSFVEPKFQYSNYQILKE